MNQINYFSWATANRLTSAIIITIKYLGGRWSISQSVRLAVLASETIEEQQIYWSASLSSFLPIHIALIAMSVCPSVYLLPSSHDSARRVLSPQQCRTLQTSWASAASFPWRVSPLLFPLCPVKAGGKWKQLALRRAEPGIVEAKRHYRNPA